MQVPAYEQCKNKLRLAELFHKRTIPQETKNTAAVILSNTINAFEHMAGYGAGGNSGVAQLNPVSTYKNHIIKLATLGIPALDVYDWVAMEPMPTATTVILFTKYIRMSNKGNSKQGDVIADPFGIYYRGDIEHREDATDATYQSAKTVDAFVNGNTTSAQDFQLRWTPLRANTAKVSVGDAVAFEAAADKVEATPTTGYDYAYTDKDGKIKVEVVRATGAIRVTTKEASNTPIIVEYEYDNINLPANDIPTYSGTVEAISLTAKPHKVRITFDSLTNLIYKNDYGIDIAKDLPKKAIEDYMYSIAQQVSDAIVEAAPKSKDLLPWSLNVMNGLILQHYASFSAVLAKAQAAITKVTKIFAGNRCFIGAALLPVVMACPGWKSVDTEGKIGTQLVGTIGNLKIYYKQNMDDYEYVVFSRGNGTEFCVGLLGMYMAALPGSIVPTQLLEYADGLNEQGFYALYDFKIINPMLSVKGRVNPAA